MDKTKIQAIKIQTTGVLTPEYNLLFSNAVIGLGGNLKLTNVANGLFINFDVGGLTGTIGTLGGFPTPPEIAKYGFELSEQFNITTMTALRDLSTELPIQTIDSLVLLKNSEYQNNLKIIVNENFPTQNGIENFFNDKVFALTAQTDGLVYFCPPVSAYLIFDIANNKIICLHSGSEYSSSFFEDNYIISTDLTKLNILGAGMTSKLIFSVPVPQQTEKVNTGRQATIIRKR